MLTLDTKDLLICQLTRCSVVCLTFDDKNLLICWLTWQQRPVDLLTHKVECLTRDKSWPVLFRTSLKVFLVTSAYSELWLTFVECLTSRFVSLFSLLKLAGPAVAGWRSSPAEQHPALPVSADWLRQAVSPRGSDPFHFWCHGDQEQSGRCAQCRSLWPIALSWYSDGEYFSVCVCVCARVHAYMCACLCVASESKVEDVISAQCNAHNWRLIGVYIEH